MKKIVDNSKKYYEEKLKRFGPNIKGLNWKNKHSQELRFKILSKIGNLNNHSILDYGCGYGDLNIFLKKKYQNYFYTGIDISKMMIDESQKRNRGKKIFYEYDIINFNFNKKFVSDYVLNSGVFTVRNNIDNKRWWEYVKVGITSMFKYSKIGIGFNLVTSSVDYKDKHLFYKNSNDVCEFIKYNLSEKIKIFHSYPLWEYTVFVYR
tara:strand:+ start:4409 stop:5029 length:621 start_codon:yes stop_codon:yes gene_type:complete